ncbi:MAG: polyribonucleotide nucleotidyltransferase, partial [Myxococcota bacterium]
MSDNPAVPRHLVSFSLGEATITLESGQIARQADGAVVIRHGGTMLLATVTRTGGPADDRGFVPLTVDYRERSSASGRVPGGYLRREARATDAETLTSRFIDRAVRPLLPKQSDALQLDITVYGADAESDLAPLATLAAGAALMVSSVPFEGPIVATRVIERKGEPTLMAAVKHRQNSPFDVLAAVSGAGLVALECGAREVDASVLIDAVQRANDGAAEALAALDSLRAQAGKTKVAAAASEADTDDTVRTQLRAAVCAGQRADGRGLTDVRPLSAEVGVLPTNHGSALFSRGETQTLVSATLATPDNAREFETLFGKKSHRFMLHYNFPGFAVGEVKGNRGPGRREIGHGTLARKALLPVFPKKGDLHHTVRVVSDVLGSDGSSSMASVCGASLALMDAGLGLQRAVAGVAMGLVAEDGAHHLLTDLSGAEDAHGDMDFKVAGSADGITAVQADTKLSALPLSLLPSIFAGATAAIE